MALKLISVKVCVVEKFFNFPHCGNLAQIAKKRRRIISQKGRPFTLPYKKEEKSFFVPTFLIPFQKMKNNKKVESRKPIFESKALYLSKTSIYLKCSSLYTIGQWNTLELYRASSIQSCSEYHQLTLIETEC